MTSTISFNSKKPMWSIYAWTLKSNRLLGILMGVLITAQMPLFVLIKGISKTYTQKNSAEMALRLDITDQLLKLSTLAAILPTLLSLLLPVLLFRYLYSKRQVDLFHAFPITRRKMFAGKYLAGLTMILLPMFFSLLLLAALRPIFIRTLVTFQIWPAFSSVFFTMLSIVLGFTVLCMFAVCSGTVADFCLSVVNGVIMIPWGISALCGMLGDVLPGFFVQLDKIWRLSPGIGYLFLSAQGNGSAAMAAIWAALLLLSFFAGLFCYGRRKSEAAEQGFALRFPVTVFQVFGQAAAGILAGQLLHKATSIHLAVCCIFGALLVMPLIELVYGRSVRNFKRAAVELAAFAVVFLSVYTFGATGGLGYANRIPAEEDVKSIALDHGRESTALEVILGIGELQENAAQRGLYEIKTDQNKKLVLSLHKLLAEQGPSAKIMPKDGQSIDSYRFTYTLKDGRTQTRCYSYLTNSAAGKLIHQIMTSSEVRVQSDEAFFIHPENLRFIANSFDSIPYPLTLEQSKQLLKVYQEEILASELTQNGQGIETVSVHLGLVQDGYEALRRADTTHALQNELEFYKWNYLSLSGSYSKTLGLLASWGVIDGRFSLKDVPADAVAAVYIKEAHSFGGGYILGDQGEDAKNNTIQFNSAKELFDLFATDLTEKSIGMEKSTMKSMIQALYEHSDENADQAAALEKSGDGYLYYFEKIKSGKRAAFSKPFFISKEDMERLTNA